VIRAVPALLVLALRRLRSRPGVTLLALLSVVLAVGLLSSTAFFAQAVDRALLQEELAALSDATDRPAFSSRIYTLPSTRRPLSLQQAERAARDVAGAFSGEIGLPVAQRVLHVESVGMMLLPGSNDARYAQSDSAYLKIVTFAYISDVAQHITTVAGDALDAAESGADETDPAEVIDVWMHTRLAEEMGVRAGETFDIAVNLSRVPRPIRVRGLWRATDPDEPYWFTDPDIQLKEALLVRRRDYMRHVEPMMAAKAGMVSWNIRLDEEQLNPAHAQRYVAGFRRGMNIINQFIPGATLDVSALDPLETFVQRQRALTTTLLSFNVPALGFLLAFLGLVAAIIAASQRRETAIFISRGLGARAVLGLTVLEECLLYVLGVPLGIGLGMGLARVMSCTRSFLAFTECTPLPVSLQGLHPGLLAVALGATLLARLIPAFAATRQSVVVQEREGARPLRPPWWQRLYLDFLLVPPAYYAYQQLVQRGTLARPEGQPGDLFHDPLLILMPALLVLCGALLVMRLFLWTMRLLDAAVQRTPWMTIHLALRQLSRHSHTYATPLLLLIIALALGIYTYALAASLDQWLVDRIYYSVGADVSFLPFIETDDDEPENLAAIVPTSDDFAAVAGIQAASRVGRYPARITALAGEEVRGAFLGIDRVDFPHSAWFRPDFAPESLGALMNRLALSGEYVLVSHDLLERTPLQVGDLLPVRIALQDGIAVTAEFRIAGVYTHFPTVYAGQETIIGNLDYLFQLAGAAFPHHIWLRTEPAPDPSPRGVVRAADSARTQGGGLFADIERMGLGAIQRRDAQALIAQERAQLERVGIFGTLSVGFLAATLMAALALLVYSYTALQERLYQFGVLRALGLYRRQLLAQVALEYALLIGFGALCGLWIGAATAQFVTPFLRITDDARSLLPPLLPVIERDKMTALALIFTALMLAIQLFVMARALTGRLFDALRMGHQG